MESDKQVDHILDLIERLFSDTRLELHQTLEAMEIIRSDVDSCIVALIDDISQEEVDDG